ncbi:MAG TPA: hypothetical protein VFG59_18065 [Anaeromyxobacter sp.]|nr:hypothetical protein [Anaeromyxobacter sp.]
MHELSQVTARTLKATSGGGEADPNLPGWRGTPGRGTGWRAKVVSKAVVRRRAVDEHG